MNALTPFPTFPPNPVPGQVFNNYVWNGSAWICRGGGPFANIKVMTASDTYWPTAGLSFAIVECLGGGGGGGGSIAQFILTGTAGWAGGGGGGGAGSYSRKNLQAAQLINGVIVTIGGGGAGGSSPATGVAQGGDGGATTFGALCIANGGGGGYVNNAPNGGNGNGGWGGDPGVGDLAFRGVLGGWGRMAFIDPAESFAGDTPIIGGSGGTRFGGSGQGGSTFAQSGGQAAPGYAADPGTGSGGGGGASPGSTLPANGGAGASGLVIITEYCFGNASLVQDCGCGPGVGDPCAPCPPGGQGWWTPNW